MAEKKVRVAFLGFWHSHACTNEEIQFTGLGVYGTVKANPEVEVAVAWDYDVQRGKEGADSLGIPFEPDLEKVLSGGYRRRGGDVRNHQACGGLCQGRPT